MGPPCHLPLLSPMHAYTHALPPCPPSRMAAMLLLHLMQPVGLPFVLPSPQFVASPFSLLLHHPSFKGPPVRDITHTRSLSLSFVSLARHSHSLVPKVILYYNPCVVRSIVQAKLPPLIL